MRLEGRGRGVDHEHSSGKQDRQRITARRRETQCTVDYICPPDWRHAPATSPQPPSLRPPASPRRSVTMSTLEIFHFTFIPPTVASVESAVS